jgi:PII-like signaling protein
MTRAGLKVTTYFGENARSGRHLLSDVFGDIYETNGLRTAILLRAVEGFGADHLLRSDRSTDIALNLPLISTAIDERAAIERVVPELRSHLTSGLLTVERVALGSIGPEESTIPGGASDEVKVALYLGRGERAGKKLAFVRAVEILHSNGVSGATVVLGLDGMTHGVRRRARFLSANTAVPVRVTAIGARACIESAIGELEQVLNDPSVTVEQVTVCKRDGITHASPNAHPVSAVDGPDQCQRLTVYVASGARHEGRPLGYGLIRRLYRANAAGATLTRGIWGFSGDHAPHGDRGLSVARDAPVVVTTICSRSETERLWPHIDELTRDHGLVTAETVPTVFVT